ncbi:hypothetical protein ACWGCK_13820 [Streptomyces virginiae]
MGAELLQHSRARTQRAVERVTSPGTVRDRVLGGTLAELLGL